jgi:hypothetical protein
MGYEQPYEEQSCEGERPPEEKRESGVPGGGQGRRDEPGHSGVYPFSSAEGASAEAPLRGEAEWGQGERGAAGYEDSGSSELNFETERQLELLNEDQEGFTAEQREW